jgi:hypothetical protein
VIVGVWGSSLFHDSLTVDSLVSLLAMIMVAVMMLSRRLLMVMIAIPLLLLLPLLEFKLESTSCIQRLSVQFGTSISREFDFNGSKLDVCAVQVRTYETFAKVASSQEIA